MKKKKSVTMEAEDIQKEEKLPLGRRFSSGDVPGNNINVCHIFLHFYVKYSLVTGEDCRVGSGKKSGVQVRSGTKKGGGKWEGKVW